MFNKKSLLALSLVLGLSGCFSSHYYILSTALQPEYIYEHSKLSIGVEKVTVPKYLFKREIAVAKSASEVTFVSDGTWAEDMDTGLTTRLISFLQKKFNAPNVHLYPWDTNKQPDKKVTLHISRFIAEKEYVYLEASWEIITMKTTHKTAKLFQERFKIERLDTEGIVETMHKAFGLLEAAIAHNIF